MNENNVVLENKSLFLALDQAVSELSERLMQHGQHDLLMVVLTQDAMPVASQIAKLLELNLTFSLVEENIKHPFSIDSIKFDFSMVKESGRDLPQDFIFHQERNLKATLKSIYEAVYKEISSKYPSKIIILVDELIKNGSEFLPAFIQDIAGQSDGERTSNPDLNFDGALKVDRRFIYLHSTDKHMKSVDIIIEQGVGEFDQV
jgi:hypothetical protein